MTSEVSDGETFGWVVDHYPECIMITASPAHAKPDEQILFVNKYFEQMTGYSKEEAIGETSTMYRARKPANT